MRNRSIVAALTFGVLACSLSLVPVTTAEAGCQTYTAASPYCSRGEITGPVKWKEEYAGATKHKEYTYSCCWNLPSEPYATGESDAERQARETKECAAMGGRYDPQVTPRCVKRPVKDIGKAKTGESASNDDTPAALKAVRDCRAKGWRWETSGRCVPPSQVKADCEAKGHQFDIDTGRCIKSLKAKPAQAEEQASDEGDHHKKKHEAEEHGDEDQPKKKKRHQQAEQHDDEDQPRRKKKHQQDF
jgi:hypothetical protein